MTDRVIRTLRGQAWERAKGELNSMLGTFWDDDGRFEKLDAAIKEFIKKVEDNGLQE
jgi:hypothetical protein